MEVARKHPMVLMEPEPHFLFQEYGASSLDFLFGVWTRTEHYFQVRNEVRAEIKRRFDVEGIEIPFPHRTLYTGAVTDPFPIMIVDSGQGALSRNPGKGPGSHPDEEAPEEED